MLVLDARVLSKIEDLGGRELLDEMIDVFLDVAPERLTAIREAAVAGDTQGVSFHAHSLRSSASNLGAKCVADVSARLERLAACGALGGADALVSELDPAVEAVVLALRRMRGAECAQD